MLTRRRAVLALLGIAALAGCRDEGDYVAIGGGGFVFNYRNAEANYGLVVGVRRQPPDAAILEARFEDPAGGEAIVVRKPLKRGIDRYDLQTPPVSGIVAGRPYNVVVLLLDGSGAEIQRLERSFTSDVSQQVLPERPLAIGPGYQRNLDRSTSPFPSRINPKEAPPAD